jgi:acyl carrier protein
VSGRQAPGVVGELREILAQATGREELLGADDQTPLFGAGVGLDSLSGVMLLREVHRRFGVDVAAEDLNLDALATLGTLAAFIEERAAGAAGLLGVAPHAGGPDHRTARSGNPDECPVAPGVPPERPPYPGRTARE